MEIISIIKINSFLNSPLEMNLDNFRNLLNKLVLKSNEGFSYKIDNFSLKILH